MTTLRQAVHEYLSMRRDLGFKLREAGKQLAHFVTFMERIGRLRHPSRWRWPGRNNRHTSNPRTGRND